VLLQGDSHVTSLEANPLKAEVWVGSESGEVVQLGTELGELLQRTAFEHPVMALKMLPDLELAVGLKNGELQIVVEEAVATVSKNLIFEGSRGCGACSLMSVGSEETLPLLVVGGEGECSIVEVTSRK
jgi:hypothetical protein